MHAPPTWPRPPACLPHDLLDLPPNGARIAVAGLVLVRQRPGTAKGVIFITLEDETGISNIIVWRKMYERFRRAVIAGRALKVTGRVQRESGVTHVIAEKIEDISEMLEIPEGTAMSHVHRAKSELRKALASTSEELA